MMVMSNSNRLFRVVRKWQKALLKKGHFVVYSLDGRRFMVPLEYLRSPIFKELLRMSEEEFGLPKDGPITLPCDALLMDYLVSLVQKCV